jgi:hypothetical protein
MSATPSDLVAIARLNGDFQRNYASRLARCSICDQLQPPVVAPSFGAAFCSLSCRLEQPGASLFRHVG